MTFVSYAQNFEDVILWRLLRTVENGFYVDIGAFDPVHHSVSMAFYERGWRGVHVEPLEAYVEKLRLARPDEMVIQAAVCGRQSAQLYQIGGHTTGVAEFARRKVPALWMSRLFEVPAVSLASVLARAKGREIHWMKIDVEGMEEEALASWGDSEARPWVLVIESTQPDSQLENHAKWEPEVSARGYRFGYFDGLNRFYVHESRAELLGSLGPGPNCFDNFVLYGEVLLREELERQGEKLRNAEAEIRRLSGSDETR